MSLTGSIIRAEAVDAGEASASKSSQPGVGAFNLSETAMREGAQDDQHTGDLEMFERKPASRAELEARKAFKPAQPETTEYARTQKAFHENRNRLKSERLAREAAAADSARKPKSKTEN